MKTYPTLIAVAALTLSMTTAMAQNQTPAQSDQKSATQSDQNKAVGDGSSGGPQTGAQEKIAPQGAAANATKAGQDANEAAKFGVPKEGKAGDAVTTTGTGQMNQKKQ